MENTHGMFHENYRTYNFVEVCKKNWIGTCTGAQE